MLHTASILLGDIVRSLPLYATSKCRVLSCTNSEVVRITWTKYAAVPVAGNGLEPDDFWIACTCGDVFHEHGNEDGQESFDYRCGDLALKGTNQFE